MPKVKAYEKESKLCVQSALQEGESEREKCIWSIPGEGQMKGGIPFAKTESEKIYVRIYRGN